MVPKSVQPTPQPAARTPEPRASTRGTTALTAGADRVRVVRECFAAYETGERAALDRHLADDLVFSAPPDVGINRATYFERCWAYAARIAAFDLVRLGEVGDEVVVTYEATRAGGGRFRNTEIFGFEGPRVASIEVYFGWDLG